MSQQQVGQGRGRAGVQDSCGYRVKWKGDSGGLVGEWVGGLRFLALTPAGHMTLNVPYLTHLSNRVQLRAIQ